MLKEAHRLLPPGGITVHMELPPAGEVGPVDECVRTGFERRRCFARRIPNYGIVGDAEFAEAALGRRPAPQHGNGASWFIFGAVKGG